MGYKKGCLDELSSQLFDRCLMSMGVSATPNKIYS